MLKLIYTNQFRKDYRKMAKRGCQMSKLNDVLNKLKNEEQLDEKYQDHALKGNRKNYRECHIAPDWLLVYKINKGDLILTALQTGSHSDLFGK